MDKVKFLCSFWLLLFCFGRGSPIVGQAVFEDGQYFRYEIVQNTLSVGVPFDLYVLLNEVQAVDEIQWPVLEGVQIQKMDQELITVERRHIYKIHYRVVIQKSGRSELPSVSIKTENGVIDSTPIPFDLQEPVKSERMYLEIENLRPTAYVGEVVPIKVRWLSKDPLDGYRALSIFIPYFDHAAFDVYNVSVIDPSSPKAIGLPVSGRRIVGKFAEIKRGEDILHSVEFEIKVIPKKAGVITMKKARVLGTYLEKEYKGKKKPFRSQYPSYFNNNFFNVPSSADLYNQVYTEYDVPDETVLELPEEGRPESFSGIVGAFEVRADVNEVKVRAGDPMTYNLYMKDHIFPQVLELSPLKNYPGFAPQFRFPEEDNTRVIHNGIAKFIRIIRPISEEVLEIPAIKLSYFDPVEEEYRFVNTESIPIEVLPSDKVSLLDIEYSDDRVVSNRLFRNPEGVWGIETNLTGEVSSSFVPLNWWILLIPVTFTFIILLLSRDYRIKKLYPKLYAKLYAKRDFDAGVSQIKPDDLRAIENLVRKYIAARFGCIAWAHQAKDLKAELAEDEISKLDNLYRELEKAHFNENGVVNPVGNMLDEAVRLIGVIETKYPVNDKGEW